MRGKDILKITGIPVLFASLCCLTPLVLVMFGFASVSFAASLSDTLYGSYRWVFRSVGLLFLILTLVIYFRSKGICTLNQVKRNRNKVLNTILIALIVSVITYILWLYVVVHYVGVWFNIWG